MGEHLSTWYILHHHVEVSVVLGKTDDPLLTLNHVRIHGVCSNALQARTHTHGTENWET